jgi:hypothetical protein
VKGVKVFEGQVASRDVAEAVRQVFAAAPGAVAKVRFVFADDDVERDRVFFFVRTECGDAVVVVDEDRKPVAVAPVDAPVAAVRKVARKITEKVQRVEVVAVDEDYVFGE